MNLFWKHFLCMVGLVLVAFTIFGNALIQSSFQSSLNREKEQAKQMLQMYQYSMLLSLHNLPEDYKMIDASAANIAQSIDKTLGNDKLVISVYNDDDKCIYQSREFSSSLISKKVQMKNGIQQIERRDGQHYYENIVKTVSQSNTYYLEIDQNIEPLYESRNRLYENYRSILLVICGITIGIAFFFSWQLVKPIKSLASVTSKFAAGDYECRAIEKGNDEITNLIQAFNHMANQLQDSIVELKEAARRQEEFTGAFSHELKTPLTSIIGYSEMLSTMELSKDEQTSCADYIYHQGKRLESLAYKMMELAQIKNQEWKFKQIDVQKLMQHVEELTNAICKQKQVTIMWNCEAGYIWGDMELLESLLGNLIDNARKASDQGQIIKISGKNKEGRYFIAIHDYGSGIPEDEIEKIQEAFYMLDKSRARKEGGAGIGMALCKKILELHQGSWQISSTVGQGTIVELDFPEVRDENNTWENE